jgi:hypothetical protein
MTEVQHIKELNLESNLQYQQKTWAVQRVAWVMLLLLLIAGAAGLFGDMGPLTWGSAGDEQGLLHIQYHRFVQYLAPIPFQIQARVSDDGGESLRLWIDRQYMDEFTVQSIIPEPDKIESTPDHLIYEFPLAETDGTIRITLYVRHLRAGLLTGRVGLEGGPTLEFSQFVYP